MSFEKERIEHTIDSCEEEFKSYKLPPVREYSKTEEIRKDLVVCILEADKEFKEKDEDLFGL